MVNNEMNEKILNKQFKKAAFSGYDATDVDSFFDSVIVYLKNNDKMVELYKEDLAKLKNAYLKLQQDFEALKAKNRKLEQEVKDYEAEGYGKN